MYPTDIREFTTQRLVAQIAQALRNETVLELGQLYGELNLEPSATVSYHAAAAAVHVLLAHSAGQVIAADEPSGLRRLPAPNGNGGGRWPKSPRRRARPRPPAPLGQTPPVEPPGQAGEVELDSDQQAPEGAGSAQVRGVRPTLPHARAVDKSPEGPAWKRVGPSPIYRYCRKCGIALPLRDRGHCENCGAPTHALPILPGGRA